MTRNQLLCRLIGTNHAGLPPAEAFEDRVDAGDAVLAAMCLARAGEVLRFEAMLPSIDTDGFKLLSRYCLMIALAGDAGIPSLLFDALRQSRPGLASLWFDLAAFEAAWGRPAQALRSLSLAQALDGGGAPIEALPDLEVERRPFGMIHFLPGNENRFFPV